MNDRLGAALHFDGRNLARLLPYTALLRHMAQALSEPAVAPLRLNVPDATRRELLVMPVLSSRLAGVKILMVVPDNSSRGLPLIGGLFLLLDAVTGLPLATMDANELTGRRTAAVSALAAQALARPDAHRLLIAGSGHLVPYLAEAHATVRPIDHIQIWARDAAKAEASARSVRVILPDCSVTVATDLAEAVGRSDIISCATRATEPLLRGEWLRPGMHVDLVGGYRPDMREADDEAVRRASLYVDNREAALAEAGDLTSPIARGIITESAILGDLTTLLSQEPRDFDRPTLFKSVGSAISDLAAAELAWEARHG